MTWLDWLAQHFPEPGARIGLWAAHGADYHAALFSLIAAGHTPVPLNTRFTADELNTAVRLIDLNGLLVDAAFPFSHAQLPPALKLFSWPTLRAAAGTAFPFDAQAADSVILCTSGSSGALKAVTLTLTSLLDHARAVNQHLRLGAQDTWLCCLPLFHVGGLAILFRSAVAGSSVLFARPGDSAEIARVLDSGDVTIASLVPTMLRALLDARADRPFHPNVRALIVGGGPVDETLLRRCPIALPTYGTTETGSMLTCARPCSISAERLSAGLPLPGTSILISDAAGNLLPPEQEGEILASSVGLFSGYVNDSNATRAALKDGWFVTGDSGYLDAHGYLHITGRTDLQIKSGGEKIHPLEIEQVLKELPGITDAVVLPIQDDTWGEVPGAVVQTTAERWTQATLAAAVAERIARHKRPRALVLVDRLPLLANGKPDLKKIQALLEKAKRV